MPFFVSFYQFHTTLSRRIQKLEVTVQSRDDLNQKLKLTVISAGGWIVKNDDPQNTFAWIRDFGEISRILESEKFRGKTQLPGTKISLVFIILNSELNQTCLENKPFAICSRTFQLEMFIQGHRRDSVQPNAPKFPSFLKWKVPIKTPNPWSIKNKWVRNSYKSNLKCRKRLWLQNRQSSGTWIGFLLQVM